MNTYKRLLLLLLITLCVLSSCSIPYNETVEFYPDKYDKPFPHNPFKGWVVWGRSPEFDKYSQPYNMIFARVYWAQIEPEKNSFDWESFEEYWNFNALTGNEKIILRVVLDTPEKHLDGMEKEIPAWLYDATGGSGTIYDVPEIGAGFSPDYSDPIFIEEHERFVKALGKRYNKDPRIAFIQIGSLGHWGEWHTWPKGSGVFPDYATAKQYVQHYIDAFPDKIIMTRRPINAHSTNPYLGIYNDLIGKNRTSLWLDRIANGYTSEWDKETHTPLEADWWHRRCSAGEFAEHQKDIQHWISGKNFANTLEQIRDSHTSWIGPRSPGKIPNSSDYQDNIDKILKILGYRYAIEQVTYNKNTTAGKRFSIDLVISNLGVAPIYYKWPLELSLIDESGKIVYQSVISSIDIRGWLPGDQYVTLTTTIPDYVEPGEYNFAIAILDPDNKNKPGIDFAIDQSLKRQDGRYVLAEISVRSSIKQKLESFLGRIIK